VESRTRLAIGGMATVAASVTVICIVALTNSLALSESDGTPIGAGPVVVPASGGTEAGDDGATPSATPTPAPVPQPIPTPQPSEPDPSPPTAEVVPAPDAQVVTPVRPSPVAEQPSPSPSAKPATPSLPGTRDEAIAQSEASGSWDPLRAWAASQGWSDGRTDALISRLERRQDDRLEIGGGDSGDRRSGDSGDAAIQGGSDSGRVSSPPTVTDDERGAVTGSSKERPANAGAGAADRTEKPGDGAKKDRSRDSPVRRDR
jgi:hypothetical protein